MEAAGVEPALCSHRLRHGARPCCDRTSERSQVRSRSSPFAHLTEVLSLQPRFLAVRAGEVISTETLTETVLVASGEEWSTTISGIELPGLSISIQ